MTRVSDFKYAEHFLRTALKQRKITFIDIPVDVITTKDAHSSDTQYDVKSGILKVCSDSLPKTLSVIIAAYLNNLDNICGKTLNGEDGFNLIKVSLAQIRALVYSDGKFPEPNGNRPLIGSLSQHPFVWLTLRDIVCPAYGCELKDIETLRASSPSVDVVRLVKEGDKLEAKNVGKPFLFINSTVEPVAYKTAYLLNQAIEAYGLEPKEIITDLLTNPELKSKFLNFAKMAFVNDKDISEFTLSLCALADFQDLPSIFQQKESSVWYKNANRMDGVPLVENNYWFMGLVETMLEPARGPDYTVKKSLEKYTVDLWERVAKEKKLRGKEDMSYEDLLRVQSADLKTRKGVTLQALLADQRIW